MYLALAPLSLLLFAPTPPGQGFWREFSVAIGIGFLTLALSAIFAVLQNQ